MNKKLTNIGTKIKRNNRSSGGDFFSTKPAYLYLVDGTSFKGCVPAWQTQVRDGEVVFNTGMTGYVESLTDPSYCNQILVFTYPLIGNYGVISKQLWESEKIYAAGVVVSEACSEWSHKASYQSLLEWLKEQDVPIICDIDTRSLTKHLRTEGTMLGSISAHKNVGQKTFIAQIPRVTIQEPVLYNQQYDKPVIVVDCGIKNGILQSLQDLPITIKRVPYNYDYTSEKYSGVLISNGPGDPTDYPETIAITKKAMATGKPIFGICLGSQIMGLAAGAKTYKLRYGHRGHNQPCLATDGERCYITSQNHGYAIDERSLPKDWAVIFRNLNDDSIEGIEHKHKPFFSVQFHPEARPGPTDTAWLFKKFYQSL